MFLPEKMKLFALLGMEAKTARVLHKQGFSLSSQKLSLAPIRIIALLICILERFTSAQKHRSNSERANLQSTKTTWK
jgi:hypothetical protein